MPTQVFSSSIWQTIAAIASIIPDMAFGAFFFLNPQLSAKEKRYSSIIIAVRPSSMNGTRATYEVFQNKCFTMEIC